MGPTEPRTEQLPEADPPGVGPAAGPRARADRRDANGSADRRSDGGVLPDAVAVDRRRRDRRGGPPRSAGLELSPGGLSLAVTVRDAGETGLPDFEEHADPQRKDAAFYGTGGFGPFTAGSRTVCRFRPWPPGGAPGEPGFTREALAEALAATTAAVTAALGAAGGSGLSGVPVEIALGGALCVTRVLTAANEAADKEAAALADRAGRYLGLGRGEKTCVTAGERLDARTKRVRVTIAPRHVAADALAVCAAAGLRPGRIEHTLATLSAGLHARGADGARPVLLLAAEGDRLDVAVAHRGRLLLDYRPVGHAAVGQVSGGDAARSTGELGGEVLLRHQKRIRRYVANQLRGQPGGDVFLAEADAAADAVGPDGKTLAAEMRAYVTGAAAVTARLSAELDPRPDLAVGPHPAPAGVDFAVCGADEPTDDAGAPAVWRVGAAVSPGPLAAVLLACGASSGGDRDPLAPAARGDLAVAVRPAGGVKWADAARAGWPVAAALLLTAGLWGAAWHAGRGVEPARAAVRAARADALFAERVRTRLDAADELDRRAAALAAAPGTGAAWVPALTGAGAALAADGPRRAWLETFAVAPPDAAPGVGAGAAAGTDPGTAAVSVVGGGYGDADVFAFADRLRRSGRFEHVQLAATREARYRTGPGVRFELTAEPAALAPLPRASTPGAASDSASRTAADGRAPAAATDTAAAPPAAARR